MVFEMKKTENAAMLFEGWQETLIWSCLQGVMGKIYTDSPEKPASAVALLGDFCFFSGKPDKELSLHKLIWDNRNFLIMVPQSEEWGNLIADSYGKAARKTIRYAIRKEPDVFDREKLQNIVDALPEAYKLQMMDEALFRRCKGKAWCSDWVSQYDNYAMYRKYGLGAVILKEGEPVSGASSYSGYVGGIEIEIDTREDYRRRGLARICGAKLILECLKRGWYPSWDAQNRWSVALAEQLGYHFDHEYAAYEVTQENGATAK